MSGLVLLMACSLLANSCGEGRDGTRTPERATLLSTALVRGDGCAAAARTLGRAYGHDVRALERGTFDRSRIVVQVESTDGTPIDEYLAQLTGPVTTALVPIADLDPHYIIPAYTNAFVRAVLQESSAIHCSPTDWAEVFVDAAGTRAVDILAAHPRSLGRPPQDVRDEITGLVANLIAAYQAWAASE